MADIKVTSSELHSVSGQLAAGSGDISARLAQLHAQVQGLVDGGWQGSASSAFSALYQQWHASAGQLKEALDGISRQLGSAAASYEQLESQLTSQLHS